MKEAEQAIMAELNRSNCILESSLELFSSVVSFNDEMYDCSGRRTWDLIGLGCTLGASSLAYTTEAELDHIRNQSRGISQQNEFAINGHENRVSYVVGSGHVYEVVAKPTCEVDPAVLLDVKEVIDEFVRVNKWHRRQQEIQWRGDRDGEVFLRFFTGLDGILRVRFIEPEQVRNRVAEKNDNARFGIIFDERDAEEVVAYLIHPLGSDGTTDNPDEILAEEIQHRTMNVDMTSPRGLPLFYPVTSNLGRAERLLRNMGELAGIRAAIALIRKHASGNKATVQDYASDMADAKITNTTTGKVQNIKDYPAGSILDVNNATDYEFPTHQTDIVAFVKALQAELRAIASRLVMPEFMLSSDASNANYASTMVAEGPAVKMFERLQASMIEDDMDIMRRAVATATAAGNLQEDVLDHVEITAEAPNVRTRDQLKDAQRDQLLATNGVLSRKTFAARHGLDYEEEVVNMDAEEEAGVGMGGEPLDLGGSDEVDDEPAEGPDETES